MPIVRSAWRSPNSFSETTELIWATKLNMHAAKMNGPSTYDDDSSVREAEEVGRCGQAGGRQRKLGGVDRQAGSRGSWEVWTGRREAEAGGDWIMTRMLWRQRGEAVQSLMPDLPDD